MYKPWITNGIVNSISRKNKLYNKYTKTKDNAQKIIYFEYKILQKAFDTANHKILLDKLNYYGFREVINNWFRSYLLDRKQKVCINGFESQIKLFTMAFLREVSLVLSCFSYT